jgi:hypothetical protein
MRAYTVAFFRKSKPRFSIISELFFTVLFNVIILQD